MKLALAQMNFKVGDLEGNAQKIIFSLERARKNSVDVVIFPEMALVGYPPEDLLKKKIFVEKNLLWLKRIEKHTRKIVAVVGFVDQDEKGLIYNSAALFEDGKIRDVYRKIKLPNYGVFDEKRYFSSGRSLSFYTFKGYKFAISICEDIWDANFVKSLAQRSTDFIINISASPFHLGKLLLRQEILSKLARITRSFVFYVNLIGGQDELIFDGTSMIFSPQGKLIKCGRRFSEDFIIFSLGKNFRYSSERLDFSEEEEAFFALKLGITDYVHKNNFSKAIVGVSGGIDSAVTISLATFALGKRNVAGLIMPSWYTSTDTLKDAQRVCRNLGVKYYLINIGKIFQTYLDALAPFFKGKRISKTEENIQARIRGNLLMAFSNKFGYLVLNTGNKSELSCGYCTLYGDMVGGFGVLKDVPKTLVYKLANYINKKEKREIIPLSVIKRPPSAELKPNQRDSDTLPPYEILDPILKFYVEDELSLQEIIEKGFEKNLVKKVVRLVDFNEYKRRQAPIGIKITPRAFGKDRRMPITNQFVDYFR